MLRVATLPSRSVVLDGPTAAMERRAQRLLGEAVVICRAEEPFVSMSAITDQFVDASACAIPPWSGLAWGLG